MLPKKVPKDKRTVKITRIVLNRTFFIESKIDAEGNILALEAALLEDRNLIDDKWLKETKKQIAKLREAIQNNDQTQINLEAENLEKFAEQLAEKKMDQVISQSLIGKKIDEV